MTTGDKRSLCGENPEEDVGLDPPAYIGEPERKWKWGNESEKPCDL